MSKILWFCWRFSRESRRAGKNIEKASTLRPKSGDIAGLHLFCPEVLKRDNSSGRWEKIHKCYKGGWFKLPVQWFKVRIQEKVVYNCSLWQKVVLPKIIRHNFMFKSQLSIFQMFCFILTLLQAHVEFTSLARQIRPYRLPKSVYPENWQSSLGETV